jgi:hypothetical protein
MAQQRNEMGALVARLNEQEARIQKLTAGIEIRKSDTEMLVGNQ